MRAYLTEGELISDHDALTRLAVEVGLAEDEVDDAAGRRPLRRARSAPTSARRGQLGITAVPVLRRRPRARRLRRPPARRAARAAAPGLGGPQPGAGRDGGDTCGVDGC